MTPETHLIFIRHGQQERADSTDPHPSGLTERGRREARSIGAKLDIELSETKALSVDNNRSLATVALALYPEIQDDEITNKVLRLKESQQLLTTPKLSYMPVEDKGFEEQLANSFYQGRALRFLVDKSDEHVLAENTKMSTYSILANEAARTLKYFYQKYTLSDKLYPPDEKDLFRIFCGREFVYASFRAKLLENTQGIEARDAYVSWYSDTIEWSHEAREDVASTKIVRSINDNIEFSLKDSYGEMQFGIDDVEKIIHDYQEKFSIKQHERRIV